MPVQGIDQDDDSYGDDIGDWMAQRQQDVANRDQNIAAGRDAWVGSTGTGRNLQAATPDDVRALGADAQGQDAAAKAVPPIKRGDKVILSNDDQAGILFGEDRSYSGPGAFEALVDHAHALINADETYGRDRAKYASSHDPVRPEDVPAVEMAKYREIQRALATARAQRAQGIDPTNGALHFNARPNDSRADWIPNGSKGPGEPIRTQVGPLHNSFPYGDVPSSTAWVNTYRD